MENIATISIKRGTAGIKEPPYQQVYKVELDREISLLEVLRGIYRKLDGTLAFRNYECYRGVCGGCEVRVDNKRVRACSFLVAPGSVHTVEPVAEGQLVRDLVVAFD